MTHDPTNLDREQMLEQARQLRAQLDAWRRDLEARERRLAEREARLAASSSDEASATEAVVLRIVPGPEAETMERTVYSPQTAAALFPRMRLRRAG